MSNANPADSEWYWVSADGAVRYGNLKQLLRGLADGSVVASSLVWRRGWAHWLRAAQVDGIGYALPVSDLEPAASPALDPQRTMPPPLPHAPRGDSEGAHILREASGSTQADLKSATLVAMKTFAGRAPGGPNRARAKKKPRPAFAPQRSSASTFLPAVVLGGFLAVVLIAAAVVAILVILRVISQREMAATTPAPTALPVVSAEAPAVAAPEPQPAPTTVAPSDVVPGAAEQGELASADLAPAPPALDLDAAVPVPAPAAPPTPAGNPGSGQVGAGAMEPRPAATLPPPAPRPAAAAAQGRREVAAPAEPQKTPSATEEEPLDMAVPRNAPAAD